MRRLLLATLVVTDTGKVIIDTSLATAAPAHKAALTAVNSGPIRAIVLTHAHGDHRIDNGRRQAARSEAFRVHALLLGQDHHVRSDDCPSDDCPIDRWVGHR